MTVSINGTSGIVNDATDLNYTGTLTGGTGVVNLGSGQVYKDASGNVGIGTSSPSDKLHVVATTTQGGIRVSGSVDNVALNLSNSGTSGKTWGIYSTNTGSGAGGGALAFYDGTAYRAIIDTSGNLLVGTTSGTARLRVVNSSDTTGGVIQFIEHTGNSDSLRIDSNTSGVAGTGAYVMPIRTAGTLRGGIQWTGANLLYNNSSDYRLKEDVQPMLGALAKVAALKPCTYKWKESGLSSQGFIAHEVAEVCPDAVSGEKDAVDADGNPQYQGIDPRFLVATLTAAIQEQQTIIVSLQDTLTALTARITALEAI